ncbi:MULTISPECIES: SPFH domain-containing protein [unclassified Paenibacillus]|uniref:SPFH domain-containing protein n=1 Tax=unclassified Paenibacillus TaxID=185978 RepID=UPI0027884DB8|nr:MULTISPECIES: SPFH domain-containing protein [unclassified Paenibacillus]MDQ0901689.1 regulator of protease activity HflC (stomatin/prohibitin superfamily) [Paenibacillus sp. V4I7]MDQ0919809.1 regulator of protease activity HflC (stomatin/prohibitin superfamily) [Paenibacillus sp. V4I5]
MKETNAWSLNGFLGLLLFIIGGGVGVLLLTQERIIPGIILIILGLIFVSTITAVNPNEASVVTFFGSYLGTIRKSGLWLIVPFSSRKKISLRVRNFNSVKLKVNDIEGNPIEIAAVIVFKVVDTYKALFDVDSYEKFVEIQSETALRHVASKYPYDRFESEGYSLRGNADEVAAELSLELQQRLSVAGVEVIESRLTHLAYSTEIASAMLQRQQASAILSARQIIVEGAVGMVQMAIARLESEGLHLDEERKAAMINNLLVAIVSDRSASPVINTGSLY